MYVRWRLINSRKEGESNNVTIAVAVGVALAKSNLHVKSNNPAFSWNSSLILYSKQISLRPPTK